MCMNIVTLLDMITMKEGNSMTLLQAMIQDPYFAMLVIGQVLSWIGFMITTVYCVKKLLFN